MLLLRRDTIAALFILLILAAGAVPCSSGAQTPPPPPPPPPPPHPYPHPGAGLLRPGPRRALPLVYVPNSKDGSVTVIDPHTYTVLRTFTTGPLPQHVVPSYDLTTLW